MTEECQGIMVSLFGFIKIAVSVITVPCQQIIKPARSFIIQIAQFAGYTYRTVTPVFRMDILRMSIKIGRHDVPGNIMSFLFLNDGISVGVLKLR